MVNTIKKSIALFLAVFFFLFSASVSISAYEAPSFAESLPTAFGTVGGQQKIAPSFHAKHARPSGTATVESYRNLQVYAGGMPFGVKFLTNGVIIVGFHTVSNSNGTISPAESAGLRKNDVLLKMNGNPIVGAAELTHVIEESEGATVDVVYSRNGTEHTTRLTPAYFEAEGRYSAGIYVRDSGAGIGTVTLILPKTGAFAGLGHGICDGESGALIPMQRGSILNVTINGVIRGLPGTPGEVQGHFSSGKTGSLLENTECGVYGIFAELPEAVPKQTTPIGLRDEVKEGRASVLCTVQGCTPQEYTVELSQIQRDATGNKCFTVHVTDAALLEKTGGIIQGMSGSPILQNGKIIGAVTHVLINDPTTGYGIFIENMLNQMGDLIP